MTFTATPEARYGGKIIEIEDHTGFYIGDVVKTERGFNAQTLITSCGSYGHHPEWRETLSEAVMDITDMRIGLAPMIV